MIGIIGYAVPSKSGIAVRELRAALGIPSERQFTIYSYTHGGWDNKWAEGTFLNGAPQDVGMKGRWQWEVKQDDLKYWIEANKITTVIFVGDTFGAYSTASAKRAGAKTVLVDDPDINSENVNDVDLRIGYQGSIMQSAEIFKSWLNAQES